MCWDDECPASPAEEDIPMTLRLSDDGSDGPISAAGCASELEGCSEGDGGVHAEVQRRLLDGEWTRLRLDEAQALIQHLRSCPACAAVLADYDQLRAALGPHAVTAEDGADGDGAAHAAVAFAAGPAWCRGRRPLAIAGLAVAAVVGVVAGVGLLVEAMDGMDAAGDSAALTRPAALAIDSASSDVAAAGLLPSDSETALSAAAFAHVAEAFDHQTAWLALTDGGESQLGLTPATLRPTSRLIVLRLSVLRADRLLSQADLVIVPGQSATLSQPLAAGGELHYHIDTTAEQPARLSLWVGLGSRPQPGQTLAAVATTLQMHPGRVRSAGELVADSGAYRVKIGYEETRFPAAPERGSDPDQPRQPH
jgi:hypothetical protein